MSRDLEEFKQQLDVQTDEVLTCLARIGLGSEYDAEIPLPDETSPLAEVFAAVKLVGETLKLVSDERLQSNRDLEQQLEIVSKQSHSILELSTPVLDVWDDVLILPLIGTIDTARAQQIVEQLLGAISRTQATVAIMDITGVPVVDTSVADHLLKTVEAARMIGTEVILTGVSPHNAQTLVKLGIDLSNVVTKNSLKAGLKWAFERTR